MSRFPGARAAPFILADLFAQVAVENVRMPRPLPADRAQAYYDFKKRLNEQYGRNAPPIGEYGPFIIGWDLAK